MLINEMGMYTNGYYEQTLTTNSNVYACMSNYKFTMPACFCVLNGPIYKVDFIKSFQKLSFW